jgi:hypothetical protein
MLWFITSSYIKNECIILVKDTGLVVLFIAEEG